MKFRRPEVRPVITIKAEIIEGKDLESEALEAGQYCRIVVSDNGIGFDEKYLPKIFTLFQRLHSADAYEGTGIGLSIAKKVIEKHQGLISAQSKEDEGARFILVLPLKQSN